MKHIGSWGGAEKSFCHRSSIFIRIDIPRTSPSVSLLRVIRLERILLAFVQLECCMHFFPIPDWLTFCQHSFFFPTLNHVETCVVHTVCSVRESCENLTCKRRINRWNRKRKKLLRIGWALLRHAVGHLYRWNWLTKKWERTGSSY